jgi:leucyl-tRNA synthetase
VNPDEYIANFGADTLRMYLMFLAPFEQGGDFRDSGVLGIERFLKRVWVLCWSAMDANRKMRPASASSETYVVPEDFQRSIHRTIKKVSEDIEGLKYNTAISSLMILLNEAEKMDEEIDLPRYFFEFFLMLLAPFAPHITEELWRECFKNKTSIHREPWPRYKEDWLVGETITIVLQVNGKMRGTIQMSASVTEDEAKAAALADESVKRAIGDAAPKKIIYVDKKLVNVGV